MKQLNKILFFGALSDLVTGENLKDRTFTDTDSLDEYIRSNFPKIKDHTYRIAVNLELIGKNTILKDGDEIAFLPPFAGG